MWKIKNKFIMDEVRDEEGGGSGEDVIDDSSIYEVADYNDTPEETPEEVQTGDAPEETVETPAETAPEVTGKYSLAELKELMTIANQNGGAPKDQSATKAPPPMTQDEIDAILKPVRVTKESLQALGFEEATDQQVAAMQMLLNSTVEHNKIITQLMLEKRAREIQTPLQDFQEYISAQRAQEHVKTFYSKYPGLKPYEKFVKRAAATLDATGKSTQEAMDLVAKSVIDDLKELNISVDTSAASHKAAGSAKGGTSVPAPQARPASRSGGSQQKPQSNDQPSDREIYAHRGW